VYPWESVWYGAPNPGSVTSSKATTVSNVLFATSAFVLKSSSTTYLLT